MHATAIQVHVCTMYHSITSNYPKQLKTKRFELYINELDPDGMRGKEKSQKKNTFAGEEKTITYTQTLIGN